MAGHGLAVVRGKRTQEGELGDWVGRSRGRTAVRVGRGWHCEVQTAAGRFVKALGPKGYCMSYYKCLSQLFLIFSFRVLSLRMLTCGLGTCEWRPRGVVFVCSDLRLAFVADPLFAVDTMAGGATVLTAAR